MNTKKLAIIGLLLIIIFALGGAILGLTTSNHSNIKNITTPYGTTCTIDIGNGISNESTVNEDGQKLVFDNGMFISTNKDISELTQSIEMTGTKCAKDNIIWYHMADQQLANSYSMFGGTHLKLENTNEYDVGFLKNPNGEETLIFVGSPDVMVDCFKSVKWGS